MCVRLSIDPWPNIQQPFPLPPFPFSSWSAKSTKWRNGISPAGPSLTFTRWPTVISTFQRVAGRDKKKIKWTWWTLHVALNIAAAASGTQTSIQAKRRRRTSRSVIFPQILDWIEWLPSIPIWRWPGSMTNVSFFLTDTLAEFKKKTKKNKKKNKEKENGAALSFKKENQSQMNDWAETDGWWRRTIEVDRTERPRRSREEKKNADCLAQRQRAEHSRNLPVLADGRKKKKLGRKRLTTLGGCHSE